MVNENKVIGRIVVVSLVGIFSLYALQFILQRFFPVEEEPIPVEPYGAIYLSPMGHIMNVSYSIDDAPEYFGEAFPGTGNDEAGWRIYRYEYSLIDDDLEVASIRYASGNTSFDKVWDDREDYEYS